MEEWRKVGREGLIWYHDAISLLLGWSEALRDQKGGVGKMREGKWERELAGAEEKRSSSCYP